MENRIETGWLFDFYGPLLTSRQQTLLALYCEEDFSLSEIAAREGISRQAAYDAVRRGAAQLESYERQLGLLARHLRMTQGLEESLEVLRDAPGEKAEQARRILEKLLMQEVVHGAVKMRFMPQHAVLMQLTQFVKHSQNLM